MDERLSALEFRRKPRPSPEAERAFVELVRSVHAGGARFRRHHAVGPYVLDLYCPERRLAVELQPPARVVSESGFHDQVRTRYLAVFGIRVLSFSEAEIVQEGSRITREIADALADAGARVPTRGRVARGGT